MKHVLFFSIASFALLALSARAQETVYHASLGGRVTDESGGAVSAAQVVALQVETNVKSTLLSDREGRYRFPYLRVGVYEIRVSRPGFGEFARRATLTAGSAFELDVVLKVAATETTVQVSAAAELMETARSQVAGTVQESEVRALPLNGRSFLDLALLVPGVSPTNTASNQLFAETSAVPGQGLSVGSQRNFSNNFVVDGLSANDDSAGLSGMYYGLDVVQEFQVVTSGGQAELGRALGGYISVVTRSGTNTLHGDFYEYFRNQRLNAANALSHARLPLTQSQHGASLGGPLIRDRSFYFANFEQRLLNQSGLVTISPANAEAINARLAAIGFSGPRVATGLFANPVHSSNALAKVDHRFGSRDSLTVRYSMYDVHSRNSRGAGGLNAPSASAGLDDTDHTIAVSNILTLSERTVNETRGQITSGDLRALPADLTGPAVSIAGVATFGTMSGAPTGRENRLYEVVDNLSHQAGAHALRAGVDFLFNDTRITYPRAYRGSYSFSSLAAFLAGTYNNGGFTQTFGSTAVGFTNPNVGFYVQDEWKAGRRLVLNLGLRYDLQFLETIRTDRNNVSPRFGFAWSPWASRDTVIRGNLGLFYDRVPLRALANALLSAGNTTDLGRLNQISVSLSPAQTGAPMFPNILNAAVPTGALVNFTTMNPRLQNAYSEQASVEVEQRLGKNSTVAISYQRLRGLHLLMSVNQNVPSCAPAGTNNGCRPNPSYANNSQYSALADSNYNGLHVSFVQRPTAWGSYRVSYNYSKALDNVGEFFFSSPIDPYNIWQDYGLSDDDQRHRVVFNASIQVPRTLSKTGWSRIGRGFALSGTLQYYSALPFNITAGTTTVQGTTARPTVNGAFIGRNSGRAFDFLNLSLRLSRTVSLRDRFQLEFIGEAFNALNHVNGVSLNGSFGAGAYPFNPSPSFRQVTAVGEARSAQLAVRVKF